MDCCFDYISAIAIETTRRKFFDPESRGDTVKHLWKNESFRINRVVDRSKSERRKRFASFVFSRAHRDAKRVQYTVSILNQKRRKITIIKARGAKRKKRKKETEKTKIPIRSLQLSLVVTTSFYF